MHPSIRSTRKATSSSWSRRSASVTSTIAADPPAPLRTGL
jgi:hypothetical protein